MGCGASVDFEPQEETTPPVPEDPLEACLQKIEAERKMLRAKTPVRLSKEAASRYFKVAVKKVEEVTDLMEEDLDDAKAMYDSLVLHIANQDALDLKEASEGFGTDEEKMAKVIVCRLPETIELTDQIYRRNYGRSLEDQIRGENHTLAGMLTGSMTNFGKFLCYRAMPIASRDALLIHKCMSGMGCSDYILMEILSTRTNQQLKDAAAQYAIDQDGADMVERIQAETGGFGKKWYGKWCDKLVEFNRDESGEVQGDPAEMAQALYDAGEGKWMGCDEQPFIDHLCQANDETVAAIVDAYEENESSKKSLFKAVEDKMGGDLEFALLARLKPMPEFFAQRIYKACKGWGTDEECIGRCISCLTKSQCQIMEDFFNEKYADEEEPFNNMRALLASELSGSFLDAMIMMMDTASPKGHRIATTTYDGSAQVAANYFCDEVAEKFGEETCVTIGNSEMEGCFELCGFQDPNDLFICGEDLDQGWQGYNFDIAGRPKYQPNDWASLFDETPGDLDAAQTLLGSLHKANAQEDTEANAAQSDREAFEGLLPAKNNQFKWTDHILNRYRLDNSSMLEFCASRDADNVNEAVTGWGTDEGKLIRVLCALPKKQLQRVNDIYIERFGKSLREVTDDELGGFFEGNFKYFMKCALTKDTELDAELLVESMKGWGTDDTMLCELICTRSNRELREAKAIFAEQEGKPVEQWVDGDTSGGYQDFLMTCLAADRDESLVINSAQAEEQAALIGACLDGSGEYDALKLWLPRMNVKQVEEIKKKYQEKFGSDMMEAIKEKADGEWKKLLLARCYDKPSYYANTMYGAMKGWGTDENALSRIVGRSSKGDLKRAEVRFQEMFGQSLTETITSEVGGNFKKALLTYLSTEAPGAPEEAPPEE